MSNDENEKWISIIYVFLKPNFVINKNGLAQIYLYYKCVKFVITQSMNLLLQNGHKSRSMWINCKIVCVS